MNIEPDTSSYKYIATEIFYGVATMAVFAAIGVMLAYRG